MMGLYSIGANNLPLRLDMGLTVTKGGTRILGADG